MAFFKLLKKPRFSRGVKSYRDDGQVAEAIRDRFDREFYLKSYADVASAGVDPVLHYVAYGASEGRDPSESFSTRFYLESNPDVAAAGINPFLHYITWGEDEGRKPAPPTFAAPAMDAPAFEAFSAEGFDFTWYRQVYLSTNSSYDDCIRHFVCRNTWGMLRKSGPKEIIAVREYFDEEFYLRRYPDIGALDPWQHYVAHGYYENRRPSRFYHPAAGDLEETLRYAQDALSGAAKQEFLLSRIGPEELFDLDIAVPTRMDSDEEALRALIVKLKSRYAVMIVAGSLDVGGAERYATNLCRGFSELYGAENVLFVVTDTAIGDGLGWMPRDCNLLSFSDLLGDITFEKRKSLISRLISIVRPRQTICVNSFALWQGIVDAGRGLVHFTDLYAALFCYDYLPDGSRGGYASTSLREAMPYLAGIFLDNAAFFDQLVLDYSLPETARSKFTVLRSPVLNLDRPLLSRSKGQGSGRILWAGRLVRQKQPLLVLDIARLCPQFTFDMFGTPGELSIQLEEQLPSNVRLVGSYSPVDGLPSAEYDAFLYTSLWDGLPTILLDAAVNGCPIVASDTGGIGEIVHDETGWLIKDVKSPGSYASALKAIHEDPIEVERRTSIMHTLLRRQHCWTTFLKTLEASSNRACEPENNG